MKLIVNGSMNKPGDMLLLDDKGEILARYFGVRGRVWPHILGVQARYLVFIHRNGQHVAFVQVNEIVKEEGIQR